MNAEKAHTFKLKPVPPFRLDLTVWALRRRPNNTIDRWDGEIYRRVLIIADRPIELAVSQTGPPEEPLLYITATGSDVEIPVTAALDRMLGLNTDLTDFYRFAENDAQLGSLAQRFRGLKPPRFSTIFEALVNGIACQQLSLAAGISLLNRLAENYGVEHYPNVHAFPRPIDLASLKPEALRELGFSRQKARAIIELASSVVSDIDIENLNSLDDEDAIARLREIRGVGRWTAEYVLMRGMGRLHVFPGDDIGARNNLKRWLGLTGEMDYEKVQNVLSRWKPYGGLIYFHLLLDRLDEAGYFHG